MSSQLISRLQELIPLQPNLLTRAKLRASSTDAGAVNSVERERSMDEQPGFCKQSRIVGRILLVVGLACQLLASPVKAERGYTITDLGTLGGATSNADGINILGQVVGSSLTAGNIFNHAFIYSDGQMRDIGTLGGDFSFATAINIRGQVVGYSATTPTFEPPLHAFIYSDGRMRDIGTLGGDSSFATAINVRGQVVGNSHTAGNIFDHAFIYGDGQMRDIGTLGGGLSFANGINVRGQVVGYSYTAGNSAAHAFIYNDGQMRDLNSLLPAGSTWTLMYAAAISDTGQIVGYGFPNNLLSSHAFLMTPRDPELGERDQSVF